MVIDKETEEETEDEETKKEFEEEEEDEEDEDEKKKKKKSKKAKKAVDTADTEEEDEEEVEKAGTGQSPEESATAAAQAGSTVTPGKMSGQAQDVFVPQSQVGGERMGSGKTPGQESYTGKSANTDLMKSPLYVELSKDIDSFRGAVSKKLDAVEKSVKDRLDNIEANLKKFYEQPFYKSIVDSPENAAGKTGKSETVNEKIGKGQARFSS